MAELRLTRRLADGRPLREVKFPRPCVVAAIYRKGQTILPHGNDALYAGDHVYIIAARDSMGQRVRAPVLRVGDA